MSWRDRLQQAKFRGVKFYTEQASGDGGRRVALHEYPQQEQHWAEDLGRKADEQRLTAYLVGADYDLDRERLMAALEQSGPGTLEHPYLGSLRVQIQTYDWTISTRRGGYCQFTISYVLAGVRKYPAASRSTARALGAATDTAGTAAATAFQTRFSMDAQPQFIVDAAVDQLTDATDTLRTLNGRISATVAPVSTIAGQIDALGSELSTLVKQPLTLTQRVLSIVAAVLGAYSDVADAFTSYNSMVVGFSDIDVIPSTTGTRTTQATNQQSIRDMLLTVACVEMARTLANSSTPFATYNQAIRVRDTLLDQLDAIAETSDDAQYYALVELRAALIRRVDEVAPGLGRVSTVSVARSVPALVLAHQVYGDANRGDELADRNALEHPSFVPAGQAIEVLL